MSTPNTVISQLQNDLLRANTITGIDSTNIHDAITSLISSSGNSELLESGVFNNTRTDAFKIPLSGRCNFAFAIYDGEPSANETYGNMSFYIQKLHDVNTRKNEYCTFTFRLAGNYPTLGVPSNEIGLYYDTSQDKWFLCVMRQDRDHPVPVGNYHWYAYNIEAFN